MKCWSIAKSKPVSPYISSTSISISIRFKSRQAIATFPLSHAHASGVEFDSLDRLISIVSTKTLARVVHQAKAQMVIFSAYHVLRVVTDQKAPEYKPFWVVTALVYHV